MTEKERKRRRAELLAEWRELDSTPRSDWHVGFEAILRIETHRFGDRVRLRTELPLGEGPPRADFVLLVDEEGLLEDRSVFRMFRKHNICEFKNPRDALDERVIRKACGYANLYIGTAEHGKDVPPGQVTLSIFRASKPEKLFREMEKKGELEAAAVKGVYRVKGRIDLPFQIVVTGELEGPEYAAYRALTDRAAGEDIEQVIRNGGGETDSAMQEHYRVLLDLVARKNPEMIEKIRRDEAMPKGWLDFFEDEIEEMVNNGKQETRRVTTVEYIRNIMESLGVSTDRAMDTLKIPQNQRAAYAELVKQTP